MLVSDGIIDLFKHDLNEELDMIVFLILLKMKNIDQEENVFVQFIFYTGEINFLFNMTKETAKSTFLKNSGLRDFLFVLPFMADFITVNPLDSKDDIYQKLLQFYKECMGQLYKEFQNLTDGEKNKIDFFGETIVESNFNFFNLRPIWGNSNMFNHSQTSMMRVFKKRIFQKVDKDIPKNMLHWFH